MGVKDVQDFLHHALAFGRVIALDSGDDARVHVTIEDDPTDLFQSCLDRLYLTDDIDAIGILFYHAYDPTQVPFDGPETFDSTFILHILLHPPPWGQG